MPVALCRSRVLDRIPFQGDPLPLGFDFLRAARSHAAVACSGYRMIYCIRFGK
jgi:hypothetical protein